jgi:hypothetical protein
MKDRPKPPATLSRRRFVALVAAGSAALLAPPATAAAVKRRAKTAPAPSPMSPAVSREYARQKSSTMDTLKVIRSHGMPPGTELALVFRPLAPSRKDG